MTAAKFVTKPKVVEAVRYEGEALADPPAWLDVFEIDYFPERRFEDALVDGSDFVIEASCRISKPGMTWIVAKGSWLVMSEGRLDVHSPERFAELFEALPEGAAGNA